MFIIGFSPDAASSFFSRRDGKNEFGMPGFISADLSVPAVNC